MTLCDVDGRSVASRLVRPAGRAGACRRADSGRRRHQRAAVEACSVAAGGLAQLGRAARAAAQSRPVRPTHHRVLQVPPISYT